MAGGAALLLAAGIAAGVYFARDRGSPVVEKQPDAPAVNGGDKGQPPPVVPDPKKPEPPPMLALAPGEGTNFRAGDYEYLTDATHAGAKKWLATQKTAKHSVLWLDAYQVGSGAKFAAVAALDGRQSEWLAALDTPPARMPDYYRANDLRVRGFVLVSYSAYRDNGERWLAHLYRPGSMESHPNTESTLTATATINRNLGNGSYVRHIRPDSDPTSGTLVWSYFWDRPHPGKEPSERVEPGAHLLNGDTTSVRAFLDTHRGNGLRPGSVAACEHQGKLVFGATAYPDERATDSRYDIGLTLDELRAKSLANADFVPTSLTGYHTKDGMRFCAVWVKYAPPKADGPKPLVALDPKDGTVIAVPGYEYLTNATHAGAKKWLDAHKNAKHSALWLDSYMLGGRKGAPKFAALVALDARQPDWLAQLDVKYGTFVHNTNRGLSEIDRKRYALISHSYYAEDGDDLVAVLWHAGPFNDTTAFVLARDTAGIRYRFAQGRALQVRPHPTDDQSLFWSMHFEAKEGKGSQLVEATLAEVETFFVEKCKPGMRPSSAAAVTYLREDGWFKRRAMMWPGSVAVVLYKGAPVFGATVIDDRDAAAWDHSLSLSPAEFAGKADAAAKAGMVPVSLTGYDTKDGQRFCVVWVKYGKPNAGPTATVELDAKDGRVITAVGCEYLIDATNTGAKKWLDAHRGKHSVLWFVAYQVGDKPRFAGTVVLDARQKDWVEVLAVRSDQLENAGVLQALTNAGVDNDDRMLVSASEYTNGGLGYTAILSRKAPPWGLLWRNLSSDQIDKTMKEEIRTNRSIVRDVRPVVRMHEVVWQFGFDRGSSDQSFPLGNANEKQLTEFLKEYQTQPGLRVGSVAACEHKGKVVFGATVFADKAALASEARVGLTADDLAALAPTMAKNGFVPTVLNPYNTKDGTRFCAVWVKYAPKKLAPVIAVPGWEYLAGATKAEARAWLDARADDGHSVVWLDSYHTPDGPRFAALAALDARQKEWVALLDVPAAALAPGGDLGARVDTKTHALLCLSGYTEDRKALAALLCRRGDKFPTVGVNVPTAGLQTELVAATAKGSGVRHVRPGLNDGAPAWAHFTHWDNYQQLHRRSVNVGAGEVAKFLEDGRKEQRRPLSVAACAHAGRLVFGATTYKERGPADKVTDWVTELALSADDLRTQAADMAAKGFYPVALTGYVWEGEARFCALWYKQAKPSAAALDPKDGTVVAVPGYEYLIDATKDGAQKWLTAHKVAKHSVMWLDGYDVGGRPAFCAVAALDDRQPKWEAFLDSAHLGFDPKRFIDIKAHTLVSLSAYFDVDGGFSRDRVASLWHPGPRQSTFRAQSTEPWVQQDLTALARGDTAIRQLRPSRGVPYPQLMKDNRNWSWHYGAPEEGEKGAHVWGKSGAEVTKFLAKYREPGMRPGSVSACVFDDELVYGATVYTDKGATDWVTELGLTAADLKTKAGELGPKGFVPVSLTGYRTKDGVRFCAVWVKYAPPKK
ncbi:MAG: hypothetical protein FJ304_19740 [Planctomycetes bacterium]|nr:hypothetical protein [Planctomycetota bacterium]